MDEAVRILRRAYDAGITFYDTARGYTDSEEKIGNAFAGIRSNVVIATKSPATTRSGLLSDIDTSLNKLQTDYVDILQLHNPSVLPDPNDPESSYAGLIEAQNSGKVRFIGVSNHSLEKATSAVKSGLYDTLQFPLSHISSEADLGIILLCREHNIGLIGMKALSGGLITNSRAAFAFLRQYENLFPIWGMQRMEELEQIISFDADPPTLDDELWAQIESDRKDLAESFCRACGYCLPCPAGIQIPMAARMGLLLRRMPSEQFLTDTWRQQMHKIDNCIDCGHCKDHCPYGLDTPALLKRMLEEYDNFYSLNNNTP
jgi:aryl-alcohol dehydrogenase-like predicted oxidoreductase